MATYTYNDFQKAMTENNLTGNFSEADLRLAQSNPDAGMSILKYKLDYRNATTDEMRALANSGAEGIRSSYAGYKGGGDGGSFYLDPLSPGNFTTDAAPIYNNHYAGAIDKMLGNVINREDFSYDASTDPLYSQYKKQYTREGQRATADALGTAAAASGGIPSSYAVTAASQAGDYYAAQLTDKIPELYQLAYNKYLQDYNMQLSDLSAVQGVEQMDYTKFLNELGQYNTDRQFNYGKLLDEVNSQTQDQQEVMNKALTAAEYGDYSVLNSMGINTDNNATDWERQYNLALLAAEYGDYSGLQSLGIQPDANGLYNFNAAAAGKSGAGNSNINKTPSSDETPLHDETPAMLSEQSKKALIAQYGGTALTDAQWNEILSKYSGYGVTDATLTAAGFTKMGAGGTDGTGEKIIDGKPIEEYEAAAGNYAGVKQTAEQMLANGSKKSDALVMIKEAWKTGALNTNDYMRLYNKYRG